MNLLSEFAQPYLIGLIASLLGVPASDGPQLVAWSHAMVKMYELTNSERQARAASEAAAHFDAYITLLVRDRVRNPQQDLLSALAHTETEGEKLTERELVSTCIVLLNAGHEATVNTLGNGIVALMKHRGEWEKVVSGAVPPNVAVEEMLRWDSPLQLFERWVLEDGVEVASATLNRGDKVGFLFGSANRDPRQFEAPDKFIVDRGDTRHVGFGAGIHQCLGAPLARLELEIGLEAVVGHFPDMELAEQPRRHQTFVLRGYEGVTLRSNGP
ncbi:MAG: cytochrome P450 [Acidobacteria bacterium]|nr:cytochrome P450 [Acidobacteriota bacterium]